MVMRTPLQTRSTSSADRMLDATLSLLSKGGFAAVTVAAVASLSGASNGSLYHRFGDRTGLLLATQQRALTVIESQTAAAFARADAEPDDDLALLLLSRAALDIFEEHRGAIRAFLVEGRSLPGFEERSRRSTHLLAATITGWLRDRFGAGEQDAEAAYRLIHALGMAGAVLDEPQVSPVPLDPAVLATALARAVSAVARRQVASDGPGSRARTRRDLARLGDDVPLGADGLDVQQ